ncbi:exodeoxyribonuclease VII large subunit [Synechococcus sp. ROS8604]|uniref:exodeoxyribonuclease VII large subunit n=1 Tax=Synechococcus sp. ROS8604 TaxID=1442557 RepID=UPI001645135C|nr:exodeoxyribonuclease VII large subunit [Synechococcus sp. ROS8604]QNI89971.1 exodeoxyribonuclease VII/ large subunit [Synechococcus sp. ROS8604]
MSAESIPTYSVRELNNAIGVLLERGFAPRFVIQATASRPQVKKGHLWLTLSDGEASITAVAWASKLKQLDFVPADGDGVTVIGKLNFWSARASLAVQVLDIRPSLTTVLRRFETVKAQLLEEGIIDPSRRRTLPPYPKRIAVLTSVPSSALADMLRTAEERWPLSELVVVPIPVQGDVAPIICGVLSRLAQQHQQLGLDAIVIARGGGSREDLMVFDDADVCRSLATFPLPVVTGIGHEDDLTVADLVADHRTATPTAAMVTLMPSKESARQTIIQRRNRLSESKRWRLEQASARLKDRQLLLQALRPAVGVQRRRDQWQQRQQLLWALSPQRWLNRGFAMLNTTKGHPLQSVYDISPNEQVQIRLKDGVIQAVAKTIQADATSDAKASL